MEREEFLKGYSALAWQLWKPDEALKARLVKEPATVLAEYGLDAGKAKVVLHTENMQKGTLEDQVAMWNKGAKEGKIDLYLPLKAPENLADMQLSDTDLEAVAGGEGDCCCCCSSPCCSCS